MRLTIALFFVMAIFYSLYGYFVDKYLGGCGLALSGVIAILAILIDVKDEIVKAIKEGSHENI